MSTSKFLTAANYKVPNKTVRYFFLEQRFGQDKIMSMHLLEIVFALAVAGLVLVGGFIIGYRQAEKQQQNLFSHRELDTLTSLMESLARFSAFAKKEDDFYLDGILRIWRTHLPTLQPEIVIDLQNEEIIYSSIKKQPADWIIHALDCVQSQNPAWIDDDEKLRLLLEDVNTSPLLLAIRNNPVTRLMVFFLPKLPEEKRKALGKFFTELNTAAVDTRKRALSAAFYERLAQDLQDSNIRMKRLFANVKHNTANILSGVMAGLGYVQAQREAEKMEPRKIVEVLDNYVLPSYSVSREMVTQMNTSIDAIIEEHNNQALDDFRLNALFERHFSSWLLDQSKRIAGSVSVSWDIPDDLVINTSDLVFFQVVWNVLKNAIKYTHKGSIKITAFTGADDRIYLRVTDTGVGIPKSSQQNIGTYGFRGSQESRVDGEGIGLWGAYQMIEATGGHIYFNSTPGEGTEFNIGFLSGTK